MVKEVGDKDSPRCGLATVVQSAERDQSSDTRKLVVINSSILSSFAGLIFNMRQIDVWTRKAL